ncbi:MAG: S8 family serine peptidase [Planctomycetes bacterium]|nr:S8 family serine peptidase [Planctomycetota bacterium]
MKLHQNRGLRALLLGIGMLAGLFAAALWIATRPAAHPSAADRPALAALDMPALPAATLTAAAHADELTALLAHGHSHAQPAAIEIAEKGRALDVAAAGAAVSAPHVAGELLARIRPGLTASELERRLARLGLAVLRYDAALDVHVLQATSGSAAAAARVATLLPQLAAAPWVEWAEPNFIAVIAQCLHTPFATETDDVTAKNAPALRGCGVEGAWRGGTEGANVTVAVLDTGIDPKHVNLTGQLLAGLDLVNPGRGGAADDAGHGTAIAGLIGARALATGGMKGVAPACKLLPVKVADREGNASIADLATGITWAVNQGARILNLSLGSRVGARTLEAAVDYAWSRGALLVASVGNDNVNTCLYPAAYDKVLAVASTGPKGELGFVSNLCKEADLAAPGEQMFSTVPGGFYRPVTGTSVAAAVVSGAAALLLAKNPALTGRELFSLLKYSARPIPALAGASEIFRFGTLDLATALRRAAARPAPDVAVTRVLCLPAAPLAGQAAVLEVEVENRGTRPATLAGLSAAFGAAALAPSPAAAAGFNLDLGDRATVRFPFTAGAPGNYPIRVAAPPAAGETNRADNTRALTVTVGGPATRGLAIADLGLSEPSLDTPTLVLSCTVRNLGNQPAAGVQLRARVGADATTDGRAGADPFAVASADLAPGETRTFTFPWAVPSPAPRDVVAFAIEIDAPGAPQPLVALFDTVLGSSEGRPVRTQYQQSGDVDIIPDAPYRLRPGHPYLPLMIFVPDKASGSTSTALTFDSCKIWQKDAPTTDASGVLLYADAFGPESGTAPSATTAGLTIMDEMGVLQSGVYGEPNLNLFKDEPLTKRGRYAILRFPRAALGIPALPAAPIVKYYFVKIDWAYSTHAVTWTTTRHGTTTKMLKVTYGSSDLPTLPGEGKYYDAHVHTVAEWYFSDHVEVFSPMQAYGGPLPMIKECAWALGLTTALDDVKDNLVTTDHNCFYGSPLDATPNSDLRRPVYGPTSVAASTAGDGTVKSEFKRMREIFGASAGEELAFSQYVPIGPAAVPIGAHMLSYRGQHFDGVWHGGSDVSAGLHEGDPVYLETFLSTLASTNPAENSTAFTYAAHPFSVQGWTDLNLKKALGLDPLNRTYDYVSAVQQNFILRGLQLFNEGAKGYLPGADIGFNTLNPFPAPTWAGAPEWDRELQIGLAKYHGYLATLMKYSFVGETGKVFTRKVYISGGTDAHGDFNYSQHRLATLIEHPSTYSVSDMAFGKVRTYTFGGGKAGATPGERAIEAMADGNSIATDGPVITFNVDGDGKWNSETLKWHDGASVHENGDGAMGGNGAYDGGRTALVRRGSPDLWFGYRYANSPELGSGGGAVAAIKIYKDQDGVPNPTVGRLYAGVSVQVPKGVGSLPAGGAGVALSKKVDTGAEGSVTKLTAYSLGAFTGGDPDAAPLAAAEHRAYTNPVWAIPVDFNVTVDQSKITAASPKIPAGAITVTVKFDASMMPLPYAVHLKPLDGAGNSTDGTAPPLAVLTPTMGWTWHFEKGIENGSYTLKNPAAISLGPVYPAGKHTFVVYFKDAPKDLHGNALNRIAPTFTVNVPAAAPSKKCFVGLLADAGVVAGAGAGAVGGGTDAGAAGARTAAGDEDERGGGAAVSRWVLWLLVLGLLIGYEIVGRTTLGARLAKAARRGGKVGAGTGGVGTTAASAGASGAPPAASGTAETTSTPSSTSPAAPRP